MKLPSTPNRDPLWKLVADAVAAFNALPPEEQAKHRDEQRRSWVRGELRLRYPDMTVDEANALIDKVEKDSQ